MALRRIGRARQAAREVPYRGSDLRRARLRARATRRPRAQEPRTGPRGATGDPRASGRGRVRPVEDGLVPSNPAESKRARQARPRGGKTTAKVTDDQCWSTEQARALVAATRDDRLRALWATILGTGLRGGEALALRWEDVELDAGTLLVRRSVTTVRGQVVEDDRGGKTDAAARRIVPGDDLVALLRQHRKQQAEERLAAGPAWIDSGGVGGGPPYQVRPGRTARARQPVDHARGVLACSSRGRFPGGSGDLGGTLRGAPRCARLWRTSVEQRTRDERRCPLRVDRLPTDAIG